MNYWHISSELLLTSSLLYYCRIHRSSNNNDYTFTSDNYILVRQGFEAKEEDKIKMKYIS